MRSSMDRLPLLVQLQVHSPLPQHASAEVREAVDPWLDLSHILVRYQLYIYLLHCIENLE